jgi:hypothetical protein
MKENTTRILIFLLVFTILLGCSKGTDSVSKDMEKQFLDIVPVTDMNKSLQLEVYGDQKTFGLGHDIPLLIYNKSSHRILFTKDSRIKLFMIQDAAWLEVENEIIYTGSTLLSPQGTPLLDLTNTWAKPAFDKDMIKNGKEEVLVRIVMIGEIIENDVGTGKFAGAYIDVHITP